MDDASSLPAPAEPTRLDLDGHHRLEVVREPGASTLRVLTAAGEIALTVVVTPAGPVLRLSGAALELVTDGALTLDAAQVTIRGREGLTLASGGDARFDAAGELVTVADEQRIRARLGDVEVQANDDVRVRGERVRLNC